MDALPTKALALVTIALLATVSGCSGDGSITGKKAPDFTINTVRGDDVSLSTFDGQIVVVDFMSSMCGYCYANGRVLKPILENNPDVVVISINFGETATTELTRPGATIEDYMNNIGVDPETYPNWYFGTNVVNASKDEIANAYRVRTTPALFLVAKDGTIIRRDGIISQQYEKEIEKLD